MSVSEILSTLIGRFSSSTPLTAASNVSASELGAAVHSPLSASC